MKIMFVCHGNICRSPMAEFIMKRLLAERGLLNKHSVASSATSTEELGNPVYPPAARELRKHGIDPSGKYARQLSRGDLDKYDIFVGMDGANIRNMHRMLGEGAEGRIYKLLSFVGSSRDVADPWYVGNFDVTYRDCLEGCEALLDAIENGEIQAK